MKVDMRPPPHRLCKFHPLIFYLAHSCAHFHLNLLLSVVPERGILLIRFRHLGVFLPSSAPTFETHFPSQWQVQEEPALAYTVQRHWRVHSQPHRCQNDADRVYNKRRVDQEVVVLQLALPSLPVVHELRPAAGALQRGVRELALFQLLLLLSAVVSGHKLKWRRLRTARFLRVEHDTGSSARA